MLVLSNADALGVDLNQFAERIHKASAYAHGATHGDIVVGELAACHIAGAIYAGTGFANADSDDLTVEVAPLHHLFGLATGGTVAYGDGLDLERLDKSLKLGHRSTFLTH